MLFKNVLYIWNANKLKKHDFQKDIFINKPTSEYLGKPIHLPRFSLFVRSTCRYFIFYIMRTNEEKTPSVTEITAKDIKLLNAVKTLLDHDAPEQCNNVLTEMFLLSLRTELSDDTTKRNEQIALFESLTDFYKTINTIS